MQFPLRRCQNNARFSDAKTVCRSDVDGLDGHALWEDAGHGSAPYDARMLARRRWIAAFVGHVLRRGFADDPDWAYEVAEEVYPVWVNCDPEIAADSAFGVYDEPSGSDATKRTLH